MITFNRYEWPWHRYTHITTEPDTDATIRQPLGPHPQPPRILFISCQPRRAMIVLDEIEHTLAMHTQQPQPLVLTYGVTHKAREGFIALLFPEGVPAVLVEWMHNNGEVTDYVTFPLPCDEITKHEQWHVSQRSSDQEGEEEEGDQEEDEPRLPEGYRLVDGSEQPRPLLGANDGRYIALVSSPHEGIGILVYEDLRVLCFLAADEAIAALYFMLLMSQPLLDYSDPNLHPAARECLHVLWWIEQQARASQDGEQQEGSQPHDAM